MSSRAALVLLSLVAVFPVGNAVAQNDTFNNSDNLLDYLPYIQATNFVNDGVFSSYTADYSQGWLPSLYRNWQYTRNFTNNGEMDSSTGFNFITWNADNTTDAEASSFFNVGSINCNADIFGGYGYGGGINVFATNIYNSGSITIGADSYAKFYGDTVNFESGSILTLAAPDPMSAQSGYLLNNDNAVGQADASTNQWYPQKVFTLTQARGYMNKFPFSIQVNNSTPYFNINVINPTNVLVRMMFVLDNSGPGVSVAPAFLNLGDGSGGAHIEWTGTYTDTGSGQSVTKYFELDDDMLASGSTNILRFGDPASGVPPNYGIYSSAIPIFGTNQYAPAGFVANLLSPAVVSTNNYSYLNAQMTPSDVPLNGAPNLLPGRLEITAPKSLNLAQSGVSGMNYLLLNSTNEFDADAQSAFAVPYSDLYLGRTNGNLTLTNLIASTLPNWSGSIQAWGTTWNYTDTNGTLAYAHLGTNNVTYNYRVLVVYSQLTPYSGPQQGNVSLYASNNVVLSDALNISSNFFVNCTNLLLTANGTGVGAGSVRGEVNLFNQALSWGAATPRLTTLTNNGLVNLSYTGVNTFGTALARYGAIVNSGSILNAAGATMNTGDFENYGTISSGSGKLIVQSATTTMTNAQVLVGTVFSNAATSMVISGTIIEAGQSLTLAASGQLTDTGVNNGNYWWVGYNNQLINSTGLVLPVKPATGDLLGTTIEVVGATSKSKTKCIWAARDLGASNAGFNNNVAVGQLLLDAYGTNSQFVFTGTDTNNAIYVDNLQLFDYASYSHNDGNRNLPALVFSNNLVIYYAQAMSDGISVAEKINGFNNNHLRWVPSYAGNFSSVTLLYSNGTLNTVNAALAAESQIDSNADGVGNEVDPNPIFVPSQVNFVESVTNLPPLSLRLQWTTIPFATNYLEYSTNLTVWLPYTNFNSYYYGANVMLPNTNHGNWFVSPQTSTGPATNVWLFVPITNGPAQYYRPRVQTWLTYPQ